MSTWTASSLAKLTVKRSDVPSETFTFDGVCGEAGAGSPEDFIGAANSLLSIAGMSATITGMSRTIKQGVAEE